MAAVLTAGLVGAALSIASPATTQARTPPASAAALQANPNESCKNADANNEAERCTVKNVCVENASGATLWVLISAQGRPWTGDAPAVEVIGGQKTCRAIYAYSQASKGIGILHVKANDGANYRPIYMPNAMASTSWLALDYGTEGWPGGGNGTSKPSVSPGNNRNDSNWTLTIYGHVFPSFNFCGRNNNSTEQNETVLTVVKPCVWTTTP